MIHRYAKKVVQRAPRRQNKKDTEEVIEGYQVVSEGDQTRASKFRGVSKNGLQWQVQLGNTLARRYVGSSSSEEEAARLYDRKSIASNGLAAKTNFSYTKAEVEAII